MYVHVCRMRMCMHTYTPIDKSAAWNGRFALLPDHVMRHFLFFFSSCMHVFSRKLCWGYATVGKVRWVGVHFSAEEEGGEGGEGGEERDA